MWYFCSSLWLALSTQALKKALECALVLYIFQKHSLKDGEFSEKLGLPLELLQIILSARWNTDILSANRRLRSVLRVKEPSALCEWIWSGMFGDGWKRCWFWLMGAKGNQITQELIPAVYDSVLKDGHVSLLSRIWIFCCWLHNQGNSFIFSIKFLQGTLFPLKPSCRATTTSWCGSFRTFSRNHTDAGPHVTLAPN